MMSKKTKKEFLNEFSRSPKLAEKVLDQMSATWHELIKRPEDFRDASAGVGGFIYYKDTIPFARKNEGLILRVLRRFEEETGAKLDVPSTNNETEYYNWLAWFALENTVQEVMDYKE